MFSAVCFFVVLIENCVVQNKMRVLKRTFLEEKEGTHYDARIFCDRTWTRQNHVCAWMRPGRVARVTDGWTPRKRRYRISSVWVFKRHCQKPLLKFHSYVLTGQFFLHPRISGSHSSSCSWCSGYVFCHIFLLISKSWFLFYHDNIRLFQKFCPLWCHVFL